MSSALVQAVSSAKLFDYTSCKPVQVPPHPLILTFLLVIIITAIWYDYSERSDSRFTSDGSEISSVLTVSKEVRFASTLAIQILIILLDRIYLGHWVTSSGQ